MQNLSLDTRIVKAIPRISYGVATTVGLGFSWTGWRNCLVCVDLGVLGTAATVDVTVWECDTLGGTYVAIAGAVFPQFVKATDDNIGMVAELPLSGRKKFIRAQAIVAGAASILGVHCILSGNDRSSRSYAAQGASEAVAYPLTAAQIAFGIP